MKKKSLLLAVVICALLLVGSVSVFAVESPLDADRTAGFVSPSEVSLSDTGRFPDVAPTAWYYNHVPFVAAHRLFRG